ncbi:Acyl dehydratase [Paraburkholderia fungorum]|uniref:Acyl dehydratase n=1 Tax=Paraburkholderia fungorum TaxID=134537 RepID=A0A1H1JV13_9BURK|nr:MaoC/PaaZ C-terminal domain-containing protein [Paraburkholderia fungorum]SDR53863.1 Acyl dehydratase [Paraburkholderia fungorum]
MNANVGLRNIYPGHIYKSSRITVTEAHIVLFAGLSGDFNPLHMDATSASDNGYGRRIAHGMLGHSISTGLRSGMDDWKIVAFLETRRKFVAPIMIGDTIHFRATVAEARPSRSGKPFGVVRVEIEMLNQADQVVQSGEDTFAVLDDGEST